ncbi:sugar porter family MFS transporter [Thioclava sp. GXIMD2076]|uniref:Sugar porter family MFS transporter n=1 Tax=Thioclava kandeliae TaxID=3070818 RepID=A0ABV1SKG0_9RHOB
MSHIQTNNDGDAGASDAAGSHTKRLGSIIIVSTLGGLLFGYDTGVINGALEPLRHDLGLSAAREGFVVSILVFGAAIGAMIGGNLADRFGRRSCILALSALFIIGTIGAATAPNWEMLALFRFVLGTAVGGASAIVPIYIAEVAPHDQRGSLVTRNELMIIIGQVAAFVINAIIYNFWGHHASVWRYMLIIAVLPAFALMIGMLRMPSSPRWLSSQDRHDEALDVLRQIRPEHQARAEVRELKELGNDEADVTSMWREPWVRRLIVIGVVLGVCQQFTGINAIMYYGTQLLQDSGFSAQAAIIANILNGLMSLAGIIVGLIIMNKIDRRTMLLGGFGLIAVFHLLVGLAALWMPETAFKPYAIMVLVAAFVFFMQGTIGPLVWLLLAEMFPLRIRSFAMGICVFCLWIANAILTFVFPPFVAAFGIAPAFFIFAIIAVGSFLFVHRWVPETRGLSLEAFEEKIRAGTL